MAQVREQEVIVVGGGLVGSLLAILLADHGHRVTVYERRPDLRLAGSAGGRSINLVLTRRGIRALERVGLGEGALALTVPVLGRMMHSPAGELVYQPYGKDDAECNHSIPRSGLNAFLVEAARDRGVRFVFEARLDRADLDAGRLFFSTREGETTVDAPVVFGTDGAGSAVREALRRDPGFEESVERLSHGYKELEIPAGDDGGFRIDGRALHIWPRGDHMLMALPNRGGSFTVTLYMANAGERSFEKLADAGAVSDLFAESFADAVPLIPALGDDFFANPTGMLGTVRCGPWHRGGRVMLLGDAAHGIVPFFGQGMNSGFEDCSELADLLDEGGADWSGIFAELNRRRKPQTDAIADMALENFVEMSERVGDRRFLLRKAVEHRLEQEVPALYRSRYSMVMYSHIPFAECRAAGRIHAEILDGLCAGIDDAAEVDMERARRLIDRRLTPWLSSRGISLEY